MGFYHLLLLSFAYQLRVSYVSGFKTSIRLNVRPIDKVKTNVLRTTTKPSIFEPIGKGLSEGTQFMLIVT
jgi:hypothetical protein